MMILPQLITQQHEVLEITIRVPADKAFDAKASMVAAGMYIVDATQSEEHPDSVILTFGRQEDVMPIDGRQGVLG